MRKLISLLLAVGLCAGVALPAFAWAPEGFAETWEDLPAGVRELLPAGDTYISGIYNAQTYYVLMEDATARTIYVLQPYGDGRFYLDVKSIPLPVTDGGGASVGSTGSDYLYLFYDGEGCTFNFSRQHDGRWILQSIQAGSEFEISPIFGIVRYADPDGIHCLPGVMPDTNLATFDPEAMPQTIDEAMAMIDTTGYAMVKSEVPTDRLHLRASPSKSGASLGRYYSGTPVRVHSVEGEWAKVDVCGVEGYMMAAFLAFGQDMLSVIRYFPGLSLQEQYASEGVSLYLRPEEKDGLYVGTVGGAGSLHGTSMYILANAGDDWFHVVCGNGLTGYIQSKYLWAGNG